MPRFSICGIDELPERVDGNVTHILSILDPAWPDIDHLQPFPADRRRIIRFHDVFQPSQEKILPDHVHVRDILAFGSQFALDRQAPSGAHLLVHCHMGISRSTAAMVMILAQTFPEQSEDWLFEQLRDMRPRAWPNSRMIELADESLGRQGRLYAALRTHYGIQARTQPKVIEWMTRLGRDQEVSLAL